MLSLCDISLIRDQRYVLNALSFDLSPGDGLLIQGPNGSGKTSLLHLISGLLHPTRGTLTWLGQPLQKSSMRRAFLSSHAPLFSELTIIENLHYWLALYETQKHSAIMDALKFFNLHEKAHVVAHTLSAGERQRVHLAKMHLLHAHLWLLDEVTVNLDKANLERFEETLQEVRNAGSIVICVSHHQVHTLNKSLTFTVN